MFRSDLYYFWNFDTPTFSFPSTSTKNHRIVKSTTNQPTTILSLFLPSHYYYPQTSRPSFTTVIDLFFYVLFLTSSPLSLFNSKSTQLKSTDPLLFHQTSESLSPDINSSSKRQLLTTSRPVTSVLYLLS